MPEQDRTACNDLTPMLTMLRGKASERKVRLFAVECCRRVGHLLTNARIRAVLDVAELWADRQIPNHQRAEARLLAKAANRTRSRDLASCSSLWAADAAISTASAYIHTYLQYVLRGVHRALTLESIEAANEDKARRVCVFLDIFGYSLRPVSSRAAWRTPEVLSLAQAIYVDRAFDWLPILADALEEAGCDNPGILTHCRGPGPHARGCWAVDLILGKK